MTEPSTTHSAGAYPYGGGRLVADWQSPKARALALAAVLVAVAATLARERLALEIVDDLVLRIWLPALLAIVLAVAPPPAVRLGRIAKDLTVVSLVAAIPAGDLVPLMVACFPLVLALAVVISRSALACRLWPEAP